MKHSISTVKQLYNSILVGRRRKESLKRIWKVNLLSKQHKEVFEECCVYLALGSQLLVSFTDKVHLYVVPMTWNIRKSSILSDHSILRVTVIQHVRSARRYLCPISKEMYEMYMHTASPKTAHFAEMSGQCLHTTCFLSHYDEPNPYSLCKRPLFA